MSDNIKQKYVSYMNGENPSDEFLAALSDTLKAEEKRVRAKKKSAVKIRVISIAAAGIAACAAVPIAISLLKAPAQPIDKSTLDYAGSVNVSALDAKPLGNLGELSEITAKELANQLNASLSELLESETNSFVDARNVDGEKRLELIGKLSAAEETSAVPEGEQNRYMAVFEDGQIVKFSVFANGIVTINGSAMRFK
ncbi:MAG: hypothetical protein MSR67_06175 [Oscillospiraceae bacterium]|nr:hypothetical protein [Oscillospiraceae bacterium]